MGRPDPRADGSRETVPLDALRDGDLVAAVAPWGRSWPMAPSRPGGRRSILASPARRCRARSGRATRSRGDAEPDGCADAHDRSAGRGDAAAPDRPAGRGGRVQPRPLCASLPSAPPGPMRRSSSRCRWRLSCSGDRHLDWRARDQRRGWRSHHHLPPAGSASRVPAVLTAARAGCSATACCSGTAPRFEKLAEIDTVVFDKTGTPDHRPPGPDQRRRPAAPAFALAAKPPRPARIPLSRAIAAAARSAGIAPAEVRDITEIPGHGTEGAAAARGCAPGAPTGGRRRRSTRPPPGSGSESGAAARLTFADELRPRRRPPRTGVRGRGSRVMLLSGDADRPVGLSPRVSRHRRLDCPAATPADKVACLDTPCAPRDAAC